MSQKKLRAIYEAIDNRNYKGCLKLCNTNLQKDSHNAVVLALKALCLDRLEKWEEAVETALQVVKAKPTDGAVLSPLLMVLKGAGLHDEAMELYDNAFTAAPADEEIGIGLFLCCARARKYDRQQQVAMKMYKKFNKTRYLHWTIVCILHLARSTGNKNLAMAETFFMKGGTQEPTKIADVPTSAAARQNACVLMLHLSVLLEAGKYEPALDLLEKHKGSLMWKGDFSQLQLKILMASGRWADSLRSAYAMLVEEPEQFDTIRVLVALAFRIEEEKGTPVSSPIANRCSTKAEDWKAAAAEAAQDEVAKLSGILSGMAAEFPRPAALGMLEIQQVAFAMLEKAKGTSDKLTPWGELVDPEDKARFVKDIVTYYEAEGRKTQCFYDLKRPLAAVEDSLAAEIWGQVKAATAVRSSDDNTFVQRARWQRALGVYPDGLEATGKAWLSYWAERQEVGEVEDLVGLGVAVLLDLDQAQAAAENPPFCKRSHLLDAMALLEMACNKPREEGYMHHTPQEIQGKVLLAFISAACGMPDITVDMLKKLSIKNVQCETLVPLFLAHFVSNAGFQAAQTWIKKLVTFHDDFDRELDDALSRCFEKGTYQRLTELMEARDTFPESLTLACCRVETVLLELDQATGLPGVLETLQGLSARRAVAYADRATGTFKQIADPGLVQGLHPLPRRSMLQSMVAPGSSCCAPSVECDGTTVRCSPSCSRLVGSLVLEVPVDSLSPACPVSAVPQQSTGLEGLLGLDHNLRERSMKKQALTLAMMKAVAERNRSKLASYMAQYKEAVATPELEAQDSAPLPKGTTAAAQQACDQCVSSILDLAHQVLHCLWLANPSGEPSALQIKSLAEVEGTIAAAGEAFVKAIAGVVAGGDPLSFELGSTGVRRASAFVLGPALVLAAVLLPLITALPKKENNPAYTGLSAVRTALKALILGATGGITELRSKLDAAAQQTVDEAASAPASTMVPAGLDLAAARKQVLTQALESHKKCLATCSGSLGLRLQQLKAVKP